MARVLATVPGTNDLDRVWGLRPDFYQEFMKDHSRAIARVAPVILELCRLRLAQLFECRFSQALRYKRATEAGLTEKKIAEIPRHYASQLFTAQERCCIEFAEMFALGASNIADADVKKLEDAIGAEAMIYFLKALNVMDQLQRSMSAFRFEPPAEPPASMPEFILTEGAGRYRADRC